MSMTTVLMRMVLRYFICIVAIVSCHACANEKVRIDEEVVVAKAHEIRRAAGANIERYETISRRIVHRTKDELHGLSDKEIDDVLLIAPAPPVWLVVMRLKAGPGIRGWSFVYFFSIDKAELVKDHQY